MKLPPDRVRKLPDLIAGAQQLNPAVTPDDIVRADLATGIPSAPSKPAPADPGAAL
jgi:hypothetical protein